METPEVDEFEIDPEMERIWREDDEPSFTEIRASIPQEEEEVEEDSLEQPEDTADTEDSELGEPEIVNDTEEEESTDQPAESDDKELETEVAKLDSYKVKANGQEFDFSLDELKQLAPKAMDYTKKMQEIAPWRKSISALKEQGLGEADVNLMIDAFKGDKQAIAEVLKRTGVDALDIDTDSKATYVPNSYGQDETAIAIQDVVERISSDAEYAITERVVDGQWDSASRQAMAKDPSMIEGLHYDIKDGTYNIIAPLAAKMKALNFVSGKSDLEYYIEAGRQYFGTQAQKSPVEVVREDVKQTDISQLANKRKAAAPSKTGTVKRDVINYLDDNDEEYDEWYKNLQARN